MSIASIQLQFDREAALVLRAVGSGNMTAKAAKRHLHTILNDAVELELIRLHSYVRRSVKREADFAAEEEKRLEKLI
jgi:hypothetical protein